MTEFKIMPVSTFSYSSILKMDTSYFSETPVDFQQITWRCISENRTLDYHRSENLKSYTVHDSLAACSSAGHGK
jgi:hypothetical protein